MFATIIALTQFLLMFGLLGFHSAKSFSPEWIARSNEGNMLLAELEPSDQSWQATIGNGYVSTVVGSDTQYIAGVYNGLNSQTPSHRARIPGTSSITITNASPNGSALDVERAIFYRRSTIGAAFIEQRWYAHRVYRNLIVHEIEVVTGDAPVTLNLQLDSGLPSPDIDFNVMQAFDLNIYFGSIDVTEEPNSTEVFVAYAYNFFTTLTIAANSNATTYFFSSFYTNLENIENAVAISSAIKLIQSVSENPQELMVSHIAAWSELWSSRIEVTGDLILAKAINSSLYYIMSSVRSDWDYAPSPGGLASNGYNGHCFWDGETWMYPTMALLQPELAHTFIMYRYNRMEGAMMKAKTYDPPYNGTMYPWESAYTGEETCPLTAPTGQLEQHISGDIAFALEQYWRLTQNLTWLQEIGYPMFSQIADFWISRVTLEDNMYSINGVIPPDEYAVNVNNSVYTNVVAVYSLQFATAAAQRLQQDPNPMWSQVANNMYIPFDEVNQRHPEFDGYKGQLIKQADVVLLGFPLMYNMSLDVHYNDLVYYSNRTDPAGPAMTWGMYATAWLYLGYYDKATEIFGQSYLNNIKPPFNIWSETTTGGTVNFITGAGGFLQAVWGGYAGLRIMPDQITFDPQLPPSITNLKLAGIHFLGNEVDVSYDNTTISFMIRMTTPEAALLTINSITLIPYKNYEFPLGSYALNGS